MAHPELARIAERHGRTVSQIVFRFALDVGMVPLTGTTDAGHMRADLESSRLLPGFRRSRANRAAGELKAQARGIGDYGTHFCGLEA
ncbi:MAG: hypothetical protein ACXVBO_12930 [Isosphaeraceae bacterium]